MSNDEKKLVEVNLELISIDHIQSILKNESEKYIIDSVFPERIYIREDVFINHKINSNPELMMKYFIKFIQTLDAYPLIEGYHIGYNKSVLTKILIDFGYEGGYMLIP